MQVWSSNWFELQQLYLNNLYSTSRGATQRVKLAKSCRFLWSAQFGWVCLRAVWRESKAPRLGTKQSARRKNIFQLAAQDCSLQSRLVCCSLLVAWSRAVYLTSSKLPNLTLNERRWLAAGVANTARFLSLFALLAFDNLCSLLSMLAYR